MKSLVNPATFRNAPFGLMLLCAFAAGAQEARTATAQRKAARIASPECHPGAICFAGKVTKGQEFRKELTSELDFVLRPGWTIAVEPKHSTPDCDEFASVLNPPYRAHRDLYIDMTYGWTAEQEVAVSPRTFRFVTNCADYKVEFARLGIVLWPYTATPEHAKEAMDKLGSSPSGEGRLWITGSQISHAADTADKQSGSIEWMAFSVEIRLPRAKRDRK